MNDKILVADIGVEGGGLSIYGRESGGTWSFWKEGSSMDLDENDDEIWRAWSSDPVPDLGLLLPEEWPLFHPLSIHPAFLPWFRQAYEKAGATVRPDLRPYQEQHRHHHWIEILGHGTQQQNGKVPDQATYVPKEQGLTVESKDTTSAYFAEEMTGRDRSWSRYEVDLIVTDYFQMLRAELAGEPYSRADHSRALLPLMNGRSKSSVENKHQNISAVLAGKGLPYIGGYKPARNYQKAILPQAVEEYLIRHPDFFDSLADGVVLKPLAAPVIGDRPVEAIFEDRPEGILVPSNDEKPWLSRKGKRIDFARRDAMNRHLGQLGEEFVIEVEKRRLLFHRRDDLAAKVEWVAATCGDGVGFDVLSFDEDDDSERFIEVKTTGLGKHFPFYVTAKELRCSEDCPERFRLYRVFNFSREPRIYAIPGPLTRECRLEPVEYRASIG
jgi:hypothetical protein